MKTAANSFYNYRAYGFNIRSDIPFEQLMHGTDPTLDTITIKRCETLPDAPSNARQIGPRAQAAHDFISLNVDGVVHFVARDGNTLLYRPHNDVDQTSLQVFLMGSGLGALLMQRKFLVLHGNGVQIDGSCILCVGPSGVGKSTTAAGLMHRGYRVMSDDVCAIDNQGQIVPGIPHIKLWQEAAENLKVDTLGLSRIRPELEKYRVPMNDAFCADSVPVTRIYVLAPHQSETVTCETLTGRDKFLALQANTYRLPFVDGMELRALHFQQLAALSKTVVVKSIRRPKSGFDLDQLLDVIIVDATKKVSPA